MIERHPVWISPKEHQLSEVIGGCLVAPVKAINVVADSATLEDPTLQIKLICQKYPHGKIIEAPFPLMDAADTNQEQTQLGIDSAQVTLSGLCQNCEHRISL